MHDISLRFGCIALRNGRPWAAPGNDNLGLSRKTHAGGVSRIRSRLAIAAVLVGSLWAFGAPANAQDRPTPLDVLNFSVSVSSDVVPDTAVIVFAANRDGLDVAAITQDANQLIARAVAQAKSTPGMQVSTGSFTTSQRFDTQGNRTGWQVRSDMIVRSKDIVGLSKLAGMLSTSGPNALQVESSQFELSPELRASEENALLERGAAAFRAKANAAMKAFGYIAYSVREINLGGNAPVPIAMRTRMALQAPTRIRSEPMPLEGGVMTLTLDISGSIQLRH